MKASNKDWYKEVWSLDIKDQSWVENTKTEVDFLIQQLGLTGSERILDLGCGYGRHALEFASRGYQVVGIDITKDYIDDANKEADANQLSAEFYCMDVRKVTYENEFDVVLNMADGAIGYLENEEENLKIFDVISRALRTGGKHFMDVMSADYADCHYPCKLWDAGEKGITLSEFEWDKDSKILLYAQNDFLYGKELPKPHFEYGFPTRLYHKAEIEQIMKERSMQVIKTFGKYDGTLSGKNELQLMVYSQKN